LVEWNVGAMLQLLKAIVARREAQNEAALEVPKVSEQAVCDNTPSTAKMPLDEVKEILSLPEFNKAAAKRQKNPEKIEIPSKVVDQLRLLVREIAALYHDNPFHNCE